MKIILYKRIEYSGSGARPARRRRRRAADYWSPSRHPMTYFLKWGDGNGIIINRNLLFGHHSESKTERGVNILVGIGLYSLSSNGPSLCNQRLDKMKWSPESELFVACLTAITGFAAH